MIIWLASYPKNGNTWLRSLISAYYYTKDGIFLGDNHLKNVEQFPVKKYLESFDYDLSIPGDTSRLWVLAQEKINEDRKIKFFKTHNALVKLGNYDFTNRANSLGGIYIVRDPRNVITSLKNHYQLNDEQALDWITSEKKFIYNVQNFEEDGYSDFQFISSWSTNYKSWKVQKKVPIKIIKYEELLNSTYIVFSDVLRFIYKLTNNNEKLNKDKIKKTLQSTSFDMLKKNEKENGFSEAVTKREDRSKKVPFFNLGPKNDWKKLLNEKIIEKTENVFEKYLKELNYK